MPKLDVAAYLEGLGRFGMHFGLGRVRRLLAGLGDPHLAFPAVHVTGTNGKGSVSKMLACILEEAGHRTGLYTSPHLERFNERISVNGTDMPDRALEAIVPGVKELVDRLAREGKAHQCTYFEATTAAAFEHFRRERVDVAVVEVGLGGRLDATNVVDPLVSVITNVSLEHTDVLGRTIEKVAFEKAGVIKRGRPVVTGAWDGRAVEVIRKIALKKRAPFFMMQREVRRRPEDASLDGQHFSVYTDRGSYPRLFSPMLGAFQLENAAVAVLAAELAGEAGLRVPPGSIRRGIARARLPGRMELVRSRPSVLLDCAHNPAASERASRFVAEARKEAGWERVLLLFGILRDKDLEGVLGPMLEVSDALLFTQPATERALTAGRARRKVMGLAGRKGLSFVPDPASALEVMLGNARGKDLIWMAGSMYLVGELRSLLRERGRLG